MTSQLKHDRISRDGIPCANTGTAAPPRSLQTVRDEIDRVDEAIIQLLMRRMALADAARRCKRELGVPLFDMAREARIVRHAAERAAEGGLDAELVRDIFWRIVQMARAAQTDVREDA